MIRVLLVFENLSPVGGGSQIATISWFKNLKKLGIKTKFLINKPSNLDILKEFNQKYLIINNSIKLNFIYPDFSIALNLNKEAIKKINDFKPHIIHLHDCFLLNNSIIKIANKLKSKLIYSYHTNFKMAKVNSFPLSLIFNKKSPFTFFLEKIQFHLLKKIKFITFPSKFLVNQFKKKLNKEAFLLPYPISNYFFKKRKITKFKIKKLITVSRLSGEKRVDFLITIMTYLKDNYDLTIVGDGPDKKTLENLVKKLNLEKNVKFLGWINNEKLPLLLKEYDLFISASDYETFGIIYLEALASYLPCIVYDFPITRETIPSSMGIFIKSYNPKEWADILIKIQNNHSIYERLINNIIKNYDKIHYFNEINSTKKLIEIYKKVLKTKNL